MPDSHSIRLNILSDLHLSRAELPPPQTEADIIIMAGDISRPREALEWMRNISKPVLYVAGNHEFYGGSPTSTIQDLRRYAAGTSVHILDNDEIVLQGIRFLGSTLWTDFNLYGPGAVREKAIADALAFTLDFARIRSDQSSDQKFSPSDMEALFNTNRSWLQDKLNQRFDGPTVVITHHAPSLQSIHPRFENSPVNTCFVSDSEYLLGSDRSALWIHGHTHDSFDYHVNGTRVICNPRGYVKDGINENATFNPDLIVEVALN